MELPLSTPVKLSQVNDVPVDPALDARYPYAYWSISAKKTYGMAH